MKMNGCTISNLTKNDFFLWFSTKKRMVGNEKEKLFLVNGDFFFRNVKECIIPRHSLVTIHTLRFMSILMFLLILGGHGCCHCG